MLAAYRTLRGEYGEDMSLAIRSSATAEDLPTASVAGQQDTYLNIKGEAEYLAPAEIKRQSVSTENLEPTMEDAFIHLIETKEKERTIKRGGTRKHTGDALTKIDLQGEHVLISDTLERVQAESGAD